MLERMDGLTIKKNTIVNVLTLGLFLGLFMGGFTFAGGNGNKGEGVYETGRDYEIVVLERVEGEMEGSLSSESDLIEAFLSGLEREQRQEAVEILDGWLENNLDASPELRVAVERVLDEQREVPRGESSENNTVNSISNGNNTNNNNDSIGNNSQNGSITNNSQNGDTNNVSNNNSSGNNGNPLPPGTGGGGNFIGPSLVCEDPQWVANTRPIYMLGTPGFWISRHRCIFCGFATTCRVEALTHVANYYESSEVQPCESSKPSNCEYECCDQEEWIPPIPPNWIMVYEPYYKYTEEVPGEIIYLPDGTYTCVNCGRIKIREISSE